MQANAFRARRLELFLTLVDDVLKRAPVCRILDVGGRKAYWQGLESVWAGRRLEITLVNLGGDATPSEGIYRFEEGDGRSLPQYADDSFDVIHSNSVIEHVGGWADKRRMAAEIRRLAPVYFVQTPNFWFPLEPHMRTPFMHWLPEPTRRWIIMRRACGFYPKATTVDQAQDILSDASLVDTKGMAALFPDAEIVRERFGPLTKSLIAVRRGRP